MLLQDFPYIQTVVSGGLAYGLGWLWYSPKVMGERWLAARGKNPGDVTPKPHHSVVSFALWMLAACFFSFLVIGLTPNPGLICLACLLWVAFSMPSTVMGALYTGYPMNAVAIDSAYQLCGYYIFAVVHIAFYYAKSLQ
jgi:hypothetical protein